MSREGNQKKVRVEQKDWLTAAAVFVVLTVTMTFYEKVWSSEGAKEACGRLSNAFFVPGTLYFGFGVLSWVVSKGLFDSMGYIFRSFSLHSLLPGTHPREYRTFYDYKTAKDERGRKWMPHVLIIGAAAVVVAVVLAVVNGVM